MSRRYGLFINLDYKNRSSQECSLIWDIIKTTFDEQGFLFEKRIFVFTSEHDIEQVSNLVVQLLDQIQINSPELHIYNYLSDCFILSLDECKDIKRPDTSNTIMVEDLNPEDLKLIEMEYQDLFKNINS